MGTIGDTSDLLFAVSLLSRFQADPGIEHWKSLLHIIGYIKNTINYGLTYSEVVEIPIVQPWGMSS